MNVQRCLGVVFLTAAIAVAANAADLDWVGGGGDDNWSTSANWNPSDSDLSGDSLYFDATDMTTLGTVNSVVDGSYTVAGMRFDHPTPAADQGHVIEILEGNILTVSGNVDVGRHGPPWDVPNNSEYSTVMFTGPGEMLISGGLLVRNAGVEAPTRPATLDVSGLDKFTVDTTGAIRLGGQNNGAGDLVLSPDSSLTASSILVPGDQNWAGSYGLTSSMYLGQQNTLHADLINVGGYGLSGQMLFQGGLTNPEITIRDRTGTGPADLYVADMHGNLRNCTGTVDLTAGTVDAQFDKLYLGIVDLYNSTGGQARTDGSVGTLSMAAGTVTASDVVLGRTVDGDYNANRRPAHGILSISGGQFTATDMILAQDEAPNHDAVRGTVNFTGGTLSAGTIDKGDGGGEAEFNWTGGTLHVDFFGLDLEQHNTDGQSVLAPGQSIGTTAIDGDYLMNAGVLEIEIDPTFPNHDLVTVAGEATLNGLLDVILLDPSVEVGDSFDVVEATGGIVDNLTILPGTHSWITQVIDLVGGGQALRLTAVPEPSTLLLAIVGLGLIGLRRRRGD